MHHQSIATILLSGRPDQVHNCTLTNISMTSVGVRCLEGFNGGLTQSFMLEVRDMSTQVIIISTIYIRSIRSERAKWPAGIFVMIQSDENTLSLIMQFKWARMEKSHRCPLAVIPLTAFIISNQIIFQQEIRANFSSPVARFAVSNLIPGNVYIVSVFAFNSKGRSDPTVLPAAMLRPAEKQLHHDEQGEKAECVSILTKF